MSATSHRPHTVLVTGGAGFIGSELVTQLAQTGVRVLVLDNLVNGRRANLAHLSPAQVELVDGDVRDDALVARLAGQVHTIFHLACLGVRHSLHAPSENHDVNATGTLTVLSAAHRTGVQRVVHVSSSEVYGSAQRPRIDESHPCEPHTVYGAAKLAGEAYARAFYRTHDLGVTIVRPFNAYGPRSHHEGDAGEVIPRMMLRALAGQPLVVFGDGRQSRDFTHVSDTARGILLAAGHDGAIGRTLNIGCGNDIGIAALARRIVALVRETAPRDRGRREVPIDFQTPRPGDVARLCADASQAQALLGFRPLVSLHDGLSQLLEWYRHQDVSAATLLRDEITRAWELPSVAAAAHIGLVA